MPVGASITDITASPTADVIHSYFVFSSPDSTFGTSGTSPVDTFEFDLATVSTDGPAAFIGTGTLIDTSGFYSPAPAEFTVSFSSASNYSFTFATMPEPASLALLGLGGAGLLARRRRG